MKGKLGQSVTVLLDNEIYQSCNGVIIRLPDDDIGTYKVLVWRILGENSWSFEDEFFESSLIFNENTFPVVGNIAIVNSDEYQSLLGFIIGQTVDNTGHEMYIIELKCTSTKVNVYPEKITLIYCSDTPMKKLTTEQPVSMSPKQNNISVSFDIDINKYLSEEDMRNIAEKVFADMVTSRADHIIKTREENWHKSIADQIFDKIANKYIDQLTSKFEDKLLRKIRKMIDEDWTHSDGSTESLFETTQYALQTCIRKYVDDNSDTITSMLNKNINDTILSIGNDKLWDMISYKINIKDILRSICDDIKS